MVTTNVPVFPGTWTFSFPGTVPKITQNSHTAHFYGERVERERGLGQSPQRGPGIKVENLLKYWTSNKMGK